MSRLPLWKRCVPHAHLPHMQALVPPPRRPRLPPEATPARPHHGAPMPRARVRLPRLVGHRLPPRPRPPPPIRLEQAACLGSHLRPLAEAVGSQICLPFLFLLQRTGVVLCAMDSCRHLDCQGSPFLIVFVESDDISGLGFVETDVKPSILCNRDAEPIHELQYGFLTYLISLFFLCFSLVRYAIWLCTCS